MVIWIYFFNQKCIVSLLLCGHSLFEIFKIIPSVINSSDRPLTDVQIYRNKSLTQTQTQMHVKYKMQTTNAQETKSEIYSFFFVDARRTPLRCGFFHIYFSAVLPNCLVASAFKLGAFYFLTWCDAVCFLLAWALPFGKFEQFEFVSDNCRLLVCLSNITCCRRELVHFNARRINHPFHLFVFSFIFVVAMFEKDWWIYRNVDIQNDEISYDKSFCFP